MAADAKSAVVTGAASGIGLATARRLAEDGWSLACVDVNAEALDELVADLTTRGHRAVAVPGDVAAVATHGAAVEAAEALAPLGAWVGVAGIAATLELSTVSEEEVRRLVEVNQLGMLWGAVAALRAWDARQVGGVIVVVSSVHARHAAAGNGVYEMTKAALEALVRNLAVTYGPQGVRAVAVAPGAVSTPALQASFDTAVRPDAARRHLERQAPLNRLAATDEIAAAISFVASDEASYVSGTTLTVDGGMSSVLMLPATDPDARRPPAS